MKKCSERRKHCAMAVVRRSQKISPRRRPPFPGARDGQNLISWTLYVQAQFGEDRCTQFRVIVVTDPQTHKHTPPARPPAANIQTGPITIHCAAASAQCNKLCAWRHNVPPPLQVDNIFAFIRQMAPVTACWLFKISATS